MDKKPAFLIALIITALIANNYFLISAINEKTNLETATISRIIDGDTIQLEDGRIIRLLNINAPEKKTPHYNLSINHISSLINKQVQLEITEQDKYQRNLARVYTPNYLNLQLVQLGLASKFLVEKSEIKAFAKAEQQAISNNKGIWKPSKHQNCLTTQIFQKQEIITITNNCQMSLINWTLKDESRKIFTFTFNPQNKFNLHSTLGQSNSTDLFWQSKTNIWNNDLDSLYVFDDTGALAHYDTYGY